MNKESDRVKEYKRQKVQKGYKNISFLVSPEELKTIDKVKNFYNLSYKDLFLMALSWEQGFNSFKQIELLDLEGLNWASGKREIDDQYLVQSKEGGYAKFENKKDFVLAHIQYNPNKTEDFFPYDIHFLKDFDTFTEAQDYFYRKKFGKKHITLYVRDDFDETRPDFPWYEARKHFQKEYNNLPVYFPLGEDQ